MSFGQYVLDKDGQPVECFDTVTWGMWMQQANEERMVARDEANGIEVSTVFLGLDHRYTMSGDPVLWETMVFGLEDEIQMRYTSREDALEGHARMVAQFLKGGEA
jgi:hypothetical protein